LSKLFSEKPLVLFEGLVQHQRANQHTWFARDLVSQQPQLKSAPVQIRRKGFGAAEQWLMDRLADLNGETREPYAARGIGGTRTIPVPPQDSAP
jgi:ferredoxin-nitrate reductase